MKPTLYTKELVTALSQLSKAINEAQKAPLAAPALAQPLQNQAPIKPKKVVFDKSTGKPFEVIFSERGFEVEGTRLSFEELETAISKEYILTLLNGQGLVLDAVKMQKILKYKDKF